MKWANILTGVFLIITVILIGIMRVRTIRTWKQALCEAQWHMSYEKDLWRLARLDHISHELESGIDRNDFSSRPCSALFFEHRGLSYLLLDWIEQSNDLIEIVFVRNGERIGKISQADIKVNRSQNMTTSPVRSLLLSWKIGTEPIDTPSEPFSCVFVFRNYSAPPIPVER